MFNFCREPGSGFRGRNLRENTFIYRFKNTLEFQCILWVPLRPKKMKFSVSNGVSVAQ